MRSDVRDGDFLVSALRVRQSRTRTVTPLGLADYYVGARGAQHPGRNSLGGYQCRSFTDGGSARQFGRERHGVARRAAGHALIGAQCLEGICPCGLTRGGKACHGREHQ